MSSIEALKAEATALQLSEKALGRSMKHSEALEKVAKKHGYGNWRACLAQLTVKAREDSSAPAKILGEDVAGLKRYVSTDWNFALDIPERWNRFPPVSANSPFEVIRFLSNEGGSHALIVFRWPCDPKQPLSFYAGRTQEYLATKGYGNFSLSETNIGARPALVLECDKNQDFGFYSCRQYLLAGGTLGYTLGFGSTHREQMFELYERMARTFEILPQWLT